MKQTTEEIYNVANRNYVESQKKRLRVRWGQTLWNTATDYINEKGTPTQKRLFENLRGTDSDCFYQDEKTPLFLEELDKILE